jgi:uncharacterized protein YecT (DUF1311 family)
MAFAPFVLAGACPDTEENFRAHKEECARAETFDDQESCAQLRFEAADKAFSCAYRQYLQTLSQDAKAKKTGAQAMPRDWLRFRDRACKLAAHVPGGEAAQGVYAVKAYYGCLTALTDDQRRFLEDWLLPGRR